MSQPANPDPWYSDGLRFECTRCGNCCTGTPGSVSLSEPEIEALAQRLELTRDEFRAIYTRTLKKGDVSLRERKNGDCILYQNGTANGTTPGCSVHSQRPRQCRTWPFWQTVVQSPERWTQEAQNCPGMNQGPLHPPTKIRETTKHDGTRQTR